MGGVKISDVRVAYVTLNAEEEAQLCPLQLFVAVSYEGARYFKHSDN